MKRASIAIVVMASMLGCGIVSAEHDKAAKDNDGPFKAFREQQRSEKKAHFEARKAENEAFRATIKDKKPEEREALVKAHRDKQVQQNKDFIAKQHAQAIANIQASSLTDEEKTQKINKLQEQWAANQARHEQKMQERKAAHEARKNAKNTDKKK